MRDVRWLTDREDPRTVLTVCLAILGLVVLFAKPMLDQGTPAPWIVSVFGVALVQFVWALFGIGVGEPAGSVVRRSA